MNMQSKKEFLMFQFFTRNIGPLIELYLINKEIKMREMIIRSFAEQYGAVSKPFAFMNEGIPS